MVKSPIDEQIIYSQEFEILGQLLVVCKSPRIAAARRVHEMIDVGGRDGPRCYRWWRGNRRQVVEREQFFTVLKK